jgi:hypothetical protein
MGHLAPVTGAVPPSHFPGAEMEKRKRRPEIAMELSLERFLEFVLLRRWCERHGFPAGAFRISIYRRSERDRFRLPST